MKRRIRKRDVQLLQCDEARTQYEIALQTIAASSPSGGHNCNGQCPACIAHRYLMAYCPGYDPRDPAPWLPISAWQGLSS